MGGGGERREWEEGVRGGWGWEEEVVGVVRGWGDGGGTRGGGSGAREGRGEEGGGRRRGEEGGGRKSGGEERCGSRRGRVNEKGGEGGGYGVRI